MGGRVPIRIRLSGELDLAAQDDLRRLLEPAACADAAIIDLADVTYMDSSAVACFVQLKKDMMIRGGAGCIKLENASPRVRRLLQLCALDTLFELAPSA
jgi:anti-anti-sigma factor